MTLSLRVTLLAIGSSILFSCSDSSCEIVDLTGAAAIPYIRQHDPLPPNSFMMVPDSFLQSTTRDVETVLDELKEKGFLTYTLKDSSIKHLALLGRNFYERKSDSALFYNYSITWTNALDAFYIPNKGMEQTASTELFGRTYDEEFRFEVRNLLLGRIKISETDSLYFRKNCDRLHFKYSYTVDSLQPVAVMAGKPDLTRANRNVNISTEEYNRFSSWKF